jgi:hypothetical protein
MKGLPHRNYTLLEFGLFFYTKLPICFTPSTDQDRGRAGRTFKGSWESMLPSKAVGDVKLGDTEALFESEELHFQIRAG